MSQMQPSSEQPQRQQQQQLALPLPRATHRDPTRDPRATHKLRVSNVVCNFHVNAPIDVTVCVHAMSGRYDKVIFPAMVSVCHETHTTNSCFDTRQIVVSGSRTELHALMASHLLVSALSYETCRHDLHMRNFTIQNIVASCHMGHGLDLKRFKRDHPFTCSWDSDAFVGAYWGPDKDRVKFSFVLFVTGSVVCNGVKSMSELPEAERYLDELLMYRETPEQLEQRNAKSGLSAKQPRSDVGEPTTEQVEHAAALELYNSISRDFRCVPNPSAPARVPIRKRKRRKPFDATAAATTTTTATATTVETVASNAPASSPSAT